MRESLRRFLFPRLDRKLLLRLVCIAVPTYLVCRHVARPVFVEGISMEPTYSNHRPNICLLLAYRHTLPKRGDVVALRWAGTRRMLLKRVLAFEGETVEFREGVFYVNGSPLDEPYVKYACDWNRPPRTIRPGHLYVFGDNRSVPMENHVGGEISASRLVGRPLW